MTLSSAQIISQTICWIKSVIIEFDFCPFAQRELQRNSVYYQDCQDSTMVAALESVRSGCARLDSNPEIETLFLIFSTSFNEFHFYLDLLAQANDFLEAQNYQGIYQIASFHPRYCFAETAQQDASNYTNRSPFPMLHLLREASLTRVLENYADAKLIPDHNIEKARTIGATVFRQLLEKCTQ